MTDARYWEQIIATGFTPPLDRSLDEMTVELVELLGDSDPYRRDGLGYRVLSRWIEDGVYDDLLTGLGDGMCEGLTVGLGESDTDTVFRRSFSILIVAAALVRDNIVTLLHPTTVMRWGDEGLAWYVKECDLRGWVEGHGWAHAVAHGADFIAALARSRHVDEGSMMVLLDAIADRLVAPTRYALTQGEDERLAYATMTLLHRNTVDIPARPWIERLAESWEVPSGPVRRRQITRFGTSSAARPTATRGSGPPGRRTPITTAVRLTSVELSARSSRPRYGGAVVPPGEPADPPAPYPPPGSPVLLGASTPSNAMPTACADGCDRARGAGDPLELAGNDYLGMARHPAVTAPPRRRLPGGAPVRPAPG
jgi:hypothetical protein